MDPVSPFIGYLLERGEIAAAVVLAVVVAAGMLGVALIRARTQRRSAASIQTKRAGNVQTTVVSDVRTKGNVTVSPQQRND
jgi:Tfp pilus assembly protein PilV